MDLVLRKRLAINIYKRQSITDRLKIFNRIVGKSDNTNHTGVTYEVVSNIPKASEELEERESLAQIAATGEDCSTIDGETYIGETNLNFLNLFTEIKFLIFQKNIPVVSRPLKASLFWTDCDKVLL